MCKQLLIAFLVSVLTACGGTDPTLRGERVITIEGTKTLSQMAEDVKFSAIDRRVTDGKSDSSVRSVTAVSMVPVYVMTSDEAITAMTARNLRPANIDECLAYGKMLLKRQREEGKKGETFYFELVCLGQTIKTHSASLFTSEETINRMVPVIAFKEDDRLLGLRAWDSTWKFGIFLAIKK